MKKLLFILIFLVSNRVYAQQIDRFMVVSDLHHYSPAPNFQETILYEIILSAIAEQVDFIFLCGDLVISSFGEYTPKDSVLKDWRFALDTLNVHGIRLYACRGNNDIGSTEAWDSLFTGDFAFPSNGPDNEINITYAVVYDNILFIAMDQYVEYCKINQVWLDAMLVQNTSRHLFAAGHEPAFKLLHSNCMAAYPDERNTFWESLITAGVKIFFCGHDHFYDHTILDEGDGNQTNDVHQVIVGTGNYSHPDAEYNGDNGRWTPLRLFHEGMNGYALVEIDDARVKLTWKHRISRNIFEDGGDSYIFSPTLVEDLNVIEKFQLFQNHPNPFNPGTVISYQLPVVSEVELNIYNVLGQKVAMLVNEKQEAGQHIVRFDGLGLASGVYFYQLRMDSFISTKKCVRLR